VDDDRLADLLAAKWSSPEAGEEGPPPDLVVRATAIVRASDAARKTNLAASIARGWWEAEAFAKTLLGAQPISL